MPLDADSRQRLLGTAHQALARAAHGQRLQVTPAAFPAELQVPAATFVTLTRAGRLRGCIGRLEAQRPLIADAAANTFAAAREDPRFSPVGPAESAELDLEVAVLSPLEGLPATSRAALLAALRPRIDGLLIEDAGHRATFLPKVWEQLPEPEQFLGELLAKAGLPADHWSDTLRVQRYHVLEYH